MLTEKLHCIAPYRGFPWEGGLAMQDWPSIPGIIYPPLFSLSYTSFTFVYASSLIIICLSSVILLYPQPFTNVLYFSFCQLAGAARSAPPPTQPLSHWGFPILCPEVYLPTSNIMLTPSWPEHIQHTSLELLLRCSAVHSEIIQKTSPHQTCLFVT